MGIIYENFKNINGVAKAKSEIIENIKPGGVIILNRYDKFFNYFFNKAKKYKLKVSTFGEHKKSDIRVKKISINGKISRILVNLKAQKFNFEIKDLNIKNVLAAIAVLKVRYLNTFRKEYWSTKEVRKLKSTYIPLIIFLLKLFKPVAFEPFIIR